MALSVMQEIFILLEDEKEVPIFRLTRWGRPARGALAKLKNLGLVEKTKVNNETFYRITDKGEQYLDSVLSTLKFKNSWDKKWRLVIFDIPESRRATRDKLRRALTALGMGLLQSSVWISPQDIKSEIEALEKKYKLLQQLKFFEVSSTAQLDQQIIEKAWKAEAINDSLEKFIKEANWSLKAMGKGNGDRFNAKKLIFEYALILKKGPILPIEFIEQNTIRKQAHEVYLRLRQHAI